MGKRHKRERTSTPSSVNLCVFNLEDISEESRGGNDGGAERRMNILQIDRIGKDRRPLPISGVVYKKPQAIM